jgi:hypothetical protein
LDGALDSDYLTAILQGIAFFGMINNDIIRVSDYVISKTYAVLAPQNITAIIMRA